MNIPKRIRNLEAAPIDAINTLARKLASSGAPVISLGQAIPSFPPTTQAIAQVGCSLEELDTHIYSADAGIRPLRIAVSELLATYNNIQNVDPDRDVLITAGANQAFLTALLALLDPGDVVLLPSPYFLNHESSVRIAGGVPIEVPLLPHTGFQLRLFDLDPFWEMAPKILVIVSPNNPTGAIYEQEEICRIVHAAVDRGITVISDETYMRFVYGEAKHFSIASDRRFRSEVITISSFSKTYSISGWRIGFMVANSSFIEQAIKVQDSMLICAPVASQKAALGALTEPTEELKSRLKILDERRLFLKERLKTIPKLNWVPTQGAFFAFVQVQGCTNSMTLAKEILKEVYVTTIPGIVFGKHGEGYLRLSYGSADVTQLAEACDRLERFFSRS